MGGEVSPVADGDRRRWVSALRAGSLSQLNEFIGACVVREGFIAAGAVIAGENDPAIEVHQPLYGLGAVVGAGVEVGDHDRACDGAVGPPKLPTVNGVVCYEVNFAGTGGYKAVLNVFELVEKLCAIECV